MAEVIAGKQFPFLWEGKDRKGNRLKGRGLAKDEMELRADLRRQGIAATRVRKESQLFKGGGKVNAEDIAIFSRQLATMLTAGIPMVQAFEIIGVGHDKPSMQKLVLSIKQDIETGNALHVALGKHPLYFDDLFVNLIEAGEHAGALETVLEKIATYKEKTEALKKKIKKALFYPAAVLAVAVIVTVILLIFVIPQFESLFKGFGADLPAFTQMVINMSRWMQDNGNEDALGLHEFREVDDHLREGRQISPEVLEQGLELRNHKDQQDDRDNHGHDQHRGGVEEGLLHLLLEGFGLFLVSGDLVQQAFQRAGLFARLDEVHEQVVEIQRVLRQCFMQ
jgi:hypothetical protein